jgi:hypothetical protein
MTSHFEDRVGGGAISCTAVCTSSTECPSDVPQMFDVRYSGREVLGFLRCSGRDTHRGRVSSATICAAAAAAAAAVAGTAARDAANSVLVQLLTYTLFAVRCTAVWIMTLGAAGVWLAQPLRYLGSVLQRPLNQVRLGEVS